MKTLPKIALLLSLLALGVAVGNPIYWQYRRNQLEKWIADQERENERHDDAIRDKLNGRTPLETIDTSGFKMTEGIIEGGKCVGTKKITTSYHEEIVTVDHMYSHKMTMASTLTPIPREQVPDVLEPAGHLKNGNEYVFFGCNFPIGTRVVVKLWTDEKGNEVSSSYHMKRLDQ